MSESNGTSRAVIQYREYLLAAHGLDTSLAESMEGKFRTDIAVEVRELARKHGAKPPEPEGDGQGDTDDPAALSRQYGRRHR